MLQGRKVLLSLIHQPSHSFNFSLSHLHTLLRDKATSHSSSSNIININNHNKFNHNKHHKKINPKYNHSPKKNFFTAINLRKNPEEEEKPNRKTWLHQFLTFLHHQSTRKIVPAVYWTTLHQQLLHYEKYNEGSMKINEIKEGITHMSLQLKIDNKERYPDKVASAHLRVACLLLASYRVLTTHLRDHEDALEIVKQSFSSKGVQSYFIQGSVYVLPHLTADPIVALSRTLKCGAQVLGPGWQIQVTKDPPHNSFVSMKVNRCFYHDFFL